MKLSKLIGYLTQLEDFKLVSAQDAARATLEPTLHYIQHQDIPVSLTDTLANNYKDIHNSILKFYSTVEGFIPWLGLTHCTLLTLTWI